MLMRGQSLEVHAVYTLPDCKHNDSRNDSCMVVQFIQIVHWSGTYIGSYERTDGCPRACNFLRKVYPPMTLR